MRFFAVSLLLVLGLSAAASEPAAVLLGVLEHPQCADDPSLGARALFAKDRDHWFALSTEEASRRVALGALDWSVAFDGRRLGSLRTNDPSFKSPYAWTYPRDHLLSIAKGQTVPTIANSAGAFAGWCDAPQYRPLVLVTGGHFHDPQSWKRVRPHSSVRSELFRAFAAARGTAYSCSGALGTEPTAWSYSSSDLIVTAEYKDNAGRLLVGLTLDPKHRTCDGPPDVLDATHWFAVGDTVRYLGVGFSLVDAGDYDGDGRSEVLFWYSAYNKDGYTLFYDGLQKQVDFRWTYH